MTLILLIMFSVAAALGVAGLAAWGILQAAAGWQFDRELGSTARILHAAYMDRTDALLAGEE